MKAITLWQPWASLVALDGEDDFDAERGGYRVQTDAVAVNGGTLTSWATCPVCHGDGRCGPIPARGRQRLWRFEPT